MTTDAIPVPLTISATAEEAVRSRRDQRAEPLYVGRIRVYPRKVWGLLRQAKYGALLALLGFYYLAPWLRWDRGPDAPDQALLIDMANRRAYFFWIEIWPQEVYYLTGLLIVAALGLFLATSLFGRIWCGFACPQTVWTDLFMTVERWIEGDRNQRIKLDRAPFSFGKALKKSAKHAAWILIALLTGGAWVIYFTDAPSFVVAFATGQASVAAYFFVGLFTATTYLLAGWAREQVCTYMCPWPRIQAAMLDEDSLVVTYRAWRGEPRGKHKAGQSWEGRGHCIDCSGCVAVCPTGIDIRDGNQLECIGCGLCIDACDNVMDRIGLPRGLIAFDTARRVACGAEGSKIRWRPIRPRTILYGLLLACVGAFMLWSLGSRATLDVNILPDRAPLFVTLSDGRIQNGYTLKILNMARNPRAFAVTVVGQPGARLQIVGQTGALGFNAKPDQVATYRVLISLPPEAVTDASFDLELLLTDRASGETAAHETVFRGPRP